MDSHQSSFLGTPLDHGKCQQHDIHQCDTVSISDTIKNPMQRASIAVIIPIHIASQNIQQMILLYFGYDCVSNVLLLCSFNKHFWRFILITQEFVVALEKVIPSIIHWRLQYLNNRIRETIRNIQIQRWCIHSEDINTTVISINRNTISIYTTIQVAKWRNKSNHERYKTYIKQSRPVFFCLIM